MQIVVQSRETIRPSSATPHHLRNLKLSFFDQLSVPAPDARILLFHSAQGDVIRFQKPNAFSALKKSLSDTLTEFYPLAGSFGNDRMSIDCNDGGVEYIEARVKAPFLLDQLLSCTNGEEVEGFLPPGTSTTGGLCTVQVTVFEGCGGVVIGVRTSHGFGDSSALSSFVNSWAAVARGDTIVSPKFGFADLLPPRDLPAISPEEGAKQEIVKPAQKLITKRFVFNKSVVSALRANCASQSATQVQLVCALLYKCLIHAVRSKSSKPINLTMPISWRSRMSPPLPSHHPGNFASSAAPIEIIGPVSFHGLVGEVGKMIRRFDSEDVKNMLANNGIVLVNYVQQMVEVYMKNEAHFFQISSGCGMPFYEADFGWGRPTWAAAFVVEAENLVTLLDTKKGDGIEAWVTLNNEDMTKFVCECELILRDLGTLHIRAKI